MSHKPRIVRFATRDEVLRVDLTSIVYIEAAANYTKLVSFNGLTAFVFMNLGGMEKLLVNRFKDAPNTFVRVGKRFIINLNYVFRVNTLKQELILSDQRTFTFLLKISKDALKLLKDLVAPKPTTGMVNKTVASDQIKKADNTKNVQP